jgi:hypothetical protein
MPALRIVFVSDDIGRVETLTAQFTSRDEALAALSAAGLRVLQIAEMRPGESAHDPVTVRIAAAAEAPPRTAPIRGLAFGGAR